MARREEVGAVGDEACTVVEMATGVPIASRQEQRVRSSVENTIARSIVDSLSISSPLLRRMVDENRWVAVPKLTANFYSLLPVGYFRAADGQAGWGFVGAGEREL